MCDEALEPLIAALRRLTEQRCSLDAKIRDVRDKMTEINPPYPRGRDFRVMCRYENCLRHGGWKHVHGGACIDPLTGEH